MIEIAASTVAEFLRCLVVTEPHFPQGYALFFRGQSDASWGLVPSIRRTISWERLGGIQRHGLIAEGEVVTSPDGDVARVEKRIATVLRQIINRIGLQPYLKNEANDNLAAFAQHVGLPTRLLDWTRSPWTAAYFAAAGAVPSRSGNGSDGRLAVFAISTPFLEHSGETGPAAWASVEAAAAPTLLAQQGRLLRIDTVDLLEGATYSQWRVGHCPSELERATLGNWGVKLTLPWSQAPALLDVLQRQEIHAATLFPTNQGVAELVREVLVLRTVGTPVEAG